jgi:predicted DNA-binding protein YlxM (UPF0122 family)
MARPGHERFTEPTLAAQRRYEALRAYWVEELSAAQIAERFGYSKASVQTLICTFGEIGLAGHWIKIMLHHLFLHKARLRPGWRLIRE